LILAAQEPRFGAQSRLVLVPATVTFDNGRPADGLEAGDFVVLDNGRPQKASVDTIATGVAPVALVVAVQASGISKPVLEKVSRIGAMIQPLVTGERGCGGVLAFSDRVTWIQECTENEDLLASAFQRIYPGPAKSARMLDAASEAIGSLNQRASARKVLLLISESRDRGSETELGQVLLQAQAAGVTVYAATYSAILTAFTTKSSATGEPQAPRPPQKPSDQTGTVTGGPPECGRYGCPAPQVPPPEQRVDILGAVGELARLGKTNTTLALTAATGGAMFSFARLKGLEDAIQKLGAELHSQYLLSFTPDDRSPGYHRLEVRVSRARVRVRARPGYWSMQGTGQ
jgi:VWFA-related protein